MTFEPWQWALLVVAAFFIGLSKTGIAGIGILYVAMFANLMPAKQATGMVLPLLILGDIFAVVIYRQHTQWSHLWKLFPWTVVGVVSGWVTLKHLDDAETKHLVGGILMLMLTVHVVRKLRAGKDDAAATHAPLWFAVLTGVLAGFATQVANAAGPVMILYLLAMRLPKLEFLGTGAVFFLLLNWFKVPFMVQLGLINLDSLGLNLRLAPVVVVGALVGRFVAARINQQAFEVTALVLTVAATVKLLVF